MPKTGFFGFCWSQQVVVSFMTQRRGTAIEFMADH
jgi:hypothetical protein